MAKFYFSKTSGFDIRSIVALGRIGDFNFETKIWKLDGNISQNQVPYVNDKQSIYEGWNFNSGNYLFKTDTK